MNSPEILERPETREQETTNGPEMFHYVDKDKMVESAVMGTYVEILERLPVNAMNRVVKHQLKDRPNDATVWDFNRLGLAVAAHQRR